MIDANFILWMLSIESFIYRDRQNLRVFPTDEVISEYGEQDFEVSFIISIRAKMKSASSIRFQITTSWFVNVYDTVLTKDVQYELDRFFSFLKGFEYGDFMHFINTRTITPELLLTIRNEIEAQIVKHYKK